jgi:hypothetical protein
MANGHNVYIWDAELYGRPKSLDEALEMVVTLSEQAPSFPVSRKMLSFGQDIKKYATSDNMSPSIVDDLISCEVDVKANKTKVYCFYLPEYNWRNLLKVLLEVAQKYNLVLVDRMMPFLLLPDGLVLASCGDEMYWSDFIEEEYDEDNLPETIIEFHQLLKTHLEPLFDMHNFILEPNDINNLNALDYDKCYIKYSRKNSFSEHYISIDCKGGDGDYKLQIFFSIIEKNMINVAKLSDFQDAVDGGIILDMTEITNQPNSQFMIDNWEKLNELLLMLKLSA